MNELFSIAGKVAVITGAGGVLGGNIAQHFVQQGAKVVAIDIRQELSLIHIFVLGNGVPTDNTAFTENSYE